MLKSDGPSKKISTATFHPREIESKLSPDSKINHSSIERSRKRIFEGRSKSIRTRRHPNDSLALSVNVASQPDGKLLQKMEQMQDQIVRLTEMLTNKQKRELEEQRKVKQIIAIKDKEVKTYTLRIEELTGDLNAKDREIAMYKLEVQRLKRCKKIEMDREQLSIDGREVSSFIADTGKRSAMVHNSPDGYMDDRRMVYREDDRRGQNSSTDEYLSPFSVASIVSDSEMRKYNSRDLGYRTGFSPQNRGFHSFSVSYPTFKSSNPPKQIMVLTAKPIYPSPPQNPFF